MAANVFVHGYMGWGSFDIPYKAVPYWGMFTGDLLNELPSKQEKKDTET